jgi:hypothetical protein
MDPAGKRGSALSRDGTRFGRRIQRAASTHRSERSDRPRFSAPLVDDRIDIMPSEPLAHSPLRFLRAGNVSLVLVLAAAACRGEIGTLPGSHENSGTSGGTTGRPPLGADGKAAANLDVNRVAIHRLNNTEYDNTVHDLLGVKSSPGAAFIEDEKLFGFDDIADAFGMTDAQYEQYFNAADALVEEAFADPALKGRILVCTPASSADAGCTRRIIETFGLRAFRRPVEPPEVDRLITVSTDAVALGEDFTGGIKQAVKAMLSSPSFLYRIELDPDPSSAAAHPLAAHELASRLSYLAWSSMPDDQLFQQAESGALLTDDVLTAELGRLLKDARGNQFRSNFAGQWLGLRDLANHQVEPTAFPEWNESLRQGMVQEGLDYFAEFLTGDREMTDFFTADVNFVDGPLSKLYGLPKPAGDGLVRVTSTSDHRRGFIGLASFLTLSSYSYRTAPTLRGKWVLENLLCQHIPPPPPNVPKLDTANADTSAAAQSENVRKRLEAHRANPDCAGCHRVLDPIGLGLENFDAIGNYRTQYDNGDAIDASGALPDGPAFNGLTELTTLLAGDTRLIDCTEKKLMTYALSRGIVASDAPFSKQILDGWSSKGLGLAALLEQIVLNDTFRYRRGEPSP